MNPYPQLPKDNTNNKDPDRLNSYFDPQTQQHPVGNASQPTTYYNNNSPNYNQGYYQPNPPNYNQNYYNNQQPPYAGPPVDYNDPNNPHYQIYNNQYSPRQRSVVLAAVCFFTMIIVGIVIFIIRSSNRARYSTYYY